jgi:hypothetical protein
VAKIATLSLVFSLLLAGELWAQSYTASRSGNWSNPATWGGADPTRFAASDTAAINRGISVLQDVSLNSGGPYRIGAVAIGANTGRGSGLAVFSQYSGVTTNLAGPLTCGNGPAADGQFVFGKSATLGLNTRNLILGNCRVSSRATSKSWARVTGSGSWQTHPTVRGPYQDFDLHHVSFQNTGSLSFALEHSTGILTGGGMQESHCAHIRNGKITYGTGGSTLASVSISITGNDFRDVGNITFKGASPAAAENRFEHNTVSNASVASLDIQHYPLSVKSNVFANYVIGADGASGGNSYAGNFFTFPRTAPSGTNVIGISDAQEACAVRGNYFYTEAPNFHGFAFSGSGGTGTHEISYNVFESLFNFDGSNWVHAAVLAKRVHHNILLGSGALCDNVGKKTGRGMFCYNNTIYTDRNLTPYGDLVDIESGLYGGPFDAYNNIEAASAVAPAGSGVSNSMAGPTVQALGIVGYNSWFNVKTPYRNVGSATSGVTIARDLRIHDVYGDPLFKDPTRNLARWNAAHGSGVPSAQAAIAYLLGINGYSSQTLRQSQAPAGRGPAALLAWVTGGFAPANPALKKAGRGGVDIGALPVRDPF